MTESTALALLDTPEFSALPVSKAEQIRNTFLPMADMLAGFEAAFADVTERATIEITPELSAQARRLRLDIAKVRIAAEKARVAIKAEYVLGGKAIDGANNILKWAISQKEEALQEIEEYLERKEIERLAGNLTLRTDMLALIGFLPPDGLAALEQNVWETYFLAKQRERIEIDEAEREVKEERERHRRLNERGLERIAALGDLYGFVAVELREQLRTLSDDEFNMARTYASRAQEAHLASVRAVHEETERLALEAARLEEMRGLEELRIAAAERMRREYEAGEACIAAKPTKDRLNSWVDSFALPPLPGESNTTEAEIRVRFNGFVAWSRKLIETLNG